MSEHRCLCRMALPVVNTRDGQRALLLAVGSVTAGPEQSSLLKQHGLELLSARYHPLSGCWEDCLLSLEALAALQRLRAEGRSPFPFDLTLSRAGLCALTAVLDVQAGLEPAGLSLSASDWRTRASPEAMRDLTIRMASAVLLVEPPGRPSPATPGTPQQPGRSRATGLATLLQRRCAAPFVLETWEPGPEPESESEQGQSRVRAGSGRPAAGA